MPVPSTRNPILPARGNYADLLANVAEIQDGEICYAIDQNTIYMKEGSTLIEAGTAGGGAIVAATPPTTRDDGSDLQDGDQWYETDTGSLYVRYSAAWQQVVDGGQVVVNTINGQSGTVTLDADDIDDSATTNKFATTAQLGKLDGIEAGAQVNDVTSVNGQTGAVTVVGSVNGVSGSAVVIDADDIDDTSTTNKFITAADQGKLDGIEAGAEVNVVDSVAGYTGDVTLELTDLTDVSNTVPSANEVLAYDGISWVPTAGTPADISSSSINGLNDVDTNTWPPNNGEVLAWNSTEGAWIPAAGDTAWTAVAAGISYTDGRVGIGTNSPSYPLHIQSAENTGFQVENNTGTASRMNFKDTNTTQQPQIGSAGDELVLRTAFTERMRIDSAGNVGIGTSNPLNLLHLSTAAGTDSVIRIDEGTTTNPLRIGQTSTDSFIETTAAHPLRIGSNNTGSNALIAFETATSEKMRIDSSGKVGIGTSSPSRLLHLESNAPIIRLTDTDVSSNTEITNSSGSLNFDADSQGSGSGGAFTFTTGGTTEIVRFAATGNVGIGANSPTQKLDLEDDAGARIAFTDTGTRRYSIGNAGTGSSSLTIRDESGSANRITINDSGNVGIGTDNPLTTLEAAGAGTPAIRITDTDGTNQFGELAHNGGITYIQSRNNTSNGSIAFRSRDGSVNTEWMRITSAGNVGIGTSNPNQKLHIESTGSNTAINLNRTDAATAGLIQLGAGSGANFITNTGTKPFFIATDNTERMRIDPSGNVGIGTTVPVSFGANWKSLEISGSTGSALRFVQTTNSVVGDLLAQSDKVQLRTNTSHPLTFSTAATERMRITSAGNVGIGTSNPGAKLQIQGDDTDVLRLDRGIQDAVSYLTMDADRTTAGSYLGGVRFEWDGTEVAGVKAKTGSDLTNKDNGHLVFETAEAGTNTERMRITAAGNVGIGTSTPGGVLSIGPSNSQQQILYGDGTGTSYFRSITDVDRAGAAQVIHVQDFKWSGTTVARIGAYTGSDTVNKDDGYLTFETSKTNTSSERMRIKSDGIVNVGNTPVYADNTAAKAGGLVDGDIYRKSDGTLMIVYT